MFEISNKLKVTYILILVVTTFSVIAEDLNTAETVTDPGEAFQADLERRKKESSLYDISTPSLSSQVYPVGLNIKSYINLNYSDPETCKANYQLGFQQYEIKQLSILENAASRAIACDNSVLFSGYDDCSCNQYESCTKAIFNVDTFKNFDNTDHYKYIVLPYIAKDLSDKMTKKQISNNLDKIEEVKLLRKYAEKKGYQLPSSNNCENKNVKLSCNLEELDSFIFEKQKTCGISSKFKCHNLEDKDYTEIQDYDVSKKIKYDLYLDKISETSAVESLANEKNVNDELIEFLMSKDVSKLKKGSKASLKIEKEFHGKLEEFKVKNKLDPVLSLILKESGKISNLFNNLLEISKKTKSSLGMNLKEGLSKFKKDELDLYFSPKECPNIPTLEKICNKKDGIKLSDKGKVTNLTESELKELFNDEDLMGDYDRFKANSLSRTIKDVNEYSALVKGYRCFMFRYEFNGKKDTKRETKSSCGIAYEPPTNEKDSFFGGYKTEYESKSNETENKGPVGDIESASTSISINNLNLENKDPKNIEDKFESANELNLNKAMTDTMNNNFGSNLIPDAPIANNVHNDYDQLLPVGQSEADPKIEKSPAAMLEEKLRELTNKIAAAEQSLDKIKNGKKEDDSKATSGQSNDEMAKALEAQIKQLRSELAVAKSKAPTVIEKAEPVVARNIASVPTTTITSTRDASEDRRNYAIEPASKREPGRDSVRGFGESTPGSSSSNITSIANQATATQSRVGGLVLTKVDGLSSDAAIETITAKITEMAGQPFLIEEGGFVKEIIPVVKDGKIVLDSKGKPIFEKIIKGKVADLKSKISKRVPAAVSSQAELRKIEEAKVKTESERLKYKNLRELTDEAVK